MPTFRAHLPEPPVHFLDQVQLAYSCPLRWEKLLGDDKKRFCGQCQKHVTNLSAMTRAQAESWLTAHNDAPICVRVEVDAVGRAVHRPSFSAAAALALSFGAAACGADEDSAGGSGVVTRDVSSRADRRAQDGSGDASTHQSSFRSAHADSSGGAGIPELQNAVGGGQDRVGEPAQVIPEPLVPMGRPMMGAPPVAPDPVVQKMGAKMGEIAAPPPGFMGKVARPSND